MTEREPKSGLGKGLADIMKGSARPGQYKPIVKALQELNIEVRLKPVMIGEEVIDCLVIPAQELLVKEYEMMSGIDSNLLLGNTVSEPEAIDGSE